MLSQMNYRKETQPHGDELFPLSIHVFETDLQSTVRVYCHWHEEVELFYAVKGEAVFHMDTETFLLREGETAFVNANRLHEVEGIDGQEFTFLAVVFQPRFLSGTSLDRIQQQYIEPVLSSEIRFPSKTERGTRLAEKTAQAMQEIRNLQERKEPLFPDLICGSFRFPGFPLFGLSDIIFTELLFPFNPVLRSLLNHKWKFSPDHPELFFCDLRHFL